MGAGGSVSDADALAFVGNDVVKFDMSCSDVNTPRGESAKAEVARLRTLMVSRYETMVSTLVRARFVELDTDKSGFLEKDELVNVASWTMTYFGDKLGESKDKVVANIMKRLDANGDGKLDIEEFSKLFTMVMTRANLVQRAHLKFAELDTDQVSLQVCMRRLPPAARCLSQPNSHSHPPIVSPSHAYTLPPTPLSAPNLQSGYLEEKEIDATILWTLQAFPNADDMANYKKHLLAQVDANGKQLADMSSVQQP